MDREGLVLRGHTLVVRLNNASGWQLAPDELRRYATTVAALAGERDASDDQLRLMLGYYHSEHRLVEALRDPAHPDHRSSWAVLAAQVRRILVNRAGSALFGDHTYELEDLAQEALIDVARGLPHYRYASRFQTWLFTVVSHCLHRAIRARGANKRVEGARVQSLETIEAAGNTPNALQIPGPEGEAQLRVLAMLLANVLAQSADKRLAAVMQLWLIEELPLRAIGARLHLSVGTVHALLGQALALLRDDAALRAWAVEADYEQRPFRAGK
jgi:RNA polymerase sigma factor (sigma-70 family)